MVVLSVRHVVMMSLQQLNEKSDPLFSMSWNDFVKHCGDFVKTSDELNDGWVFSDTANKTNAVGELYLIKKTVKHLTNNMDLNAEDCDSENVCFVNGTGNSVTFWEYHILYSPSYCVPTLYFNAWRRDGSIINVDDITRLNERPEYSSNKICVLSQQEHPLLHRPFYYIHPCDTAAILQSCKTMITAGRNVNPITTWLSTIASVAQIDIPSEYACRDL